MFSDGKIRDRQEGTIMIDWNQLHHYQKAMTLWQWAFVILVVSLSIWMIVWLRSYFREDSDDADETLEMLTQFSELHQEGGLSDDEFRLIRSRLTRIAQEAFLADRTKPKEGSAELVPTNLVDSKNETSSQSPARLANAEKEEESERMSDDETG
jgi:hypothetical protein